MNVWQEDGVSLDLSNSTTDIGGEIFDPAGHLLGIVQRVVAERSNVRIVLPGTGEIVIFAGRSEYCAKVRDMAEFCLAPAARYEVSKVNDAAGVTDAGPARNIRDLLWCAAFYPSQGRLVEGCSKYDVIQFRQWPNLPRVPATRNAARICALLTRHPTTIMLVHHILGIEKEEVYRIYSAAYSAGIVERVSGHRQLAGSKTAVEIQAEPVQARGLFRSLFAKISGL